MKTDLKIDLKAKLKPLAYSLLLAGAGIGLSACGGGGGSSSGSSGTPSDSTDTQTNTINGFVMDPAVESAVVKICQLNMPSECLSEKTVTNALGAFSFTLSEEIDLSQYAIYSTGGSDASTGEDLTGVQFSAPAQLTNDSNGAVYVTPLSTLVTNKVNNGIDLANAVSQIATELGLSESDLTQATDSNADLLKKSVLLTLIGKQLDDGLEELTLNENDDLTGIVTVIENSGLSSEEQAKLLSLYEALNAASSLQSAINVFVVKNTLLTTDLFENQDLSDETVADNAGKITDAVLGYLSGQNVTEVNRSQVTLLLALMGDLDVADAELELPDLNDELTNIQLAEVEDENLLNARTPLGEALDGTSDAKREYYYRSTASHLAQSSSIIGGVTDVDTMESVYTNLAQGYLTNDNPELALKFANRKVFKPESEYKVLLKIAKYYIDKDLDAETAEAMLDKSVTLHQSYMQAKGYESVKSSDIQDLRSIFQAYSNLGLATKASSITEYMNEMIQGFGTNSNPYAQYVTGLLSAAGIYVDNNETEQARNTLKDAYDIVLVMPANQQSKYPDTSSKWYYMVKIFNMIGIAQSYYWDLGTESDKAKALEIIDKILEIRADDGIADNTGSNDTAYKTDAYMDDVIAMLADSGLSQEDAQSIIDDMPRKDTYAARVWTSYALNTPGMTTEDIIALITEKLMPGSKTTEYRDAFKYLTYNGISRTTPFLAMSLINSGELTEAKKAIDAAKAILEEAISNQVESSDTYRSKYYVQWGYAKLADLYHLVNEPNLSEQMMDNAIAIAINSEDAPENSGITNLADRAYAQIYITDYYLSMGMLDAALQYADYTRTTANNITEPGDRRSRLATLAAIMNDEGDATMQAVTPILDDIYEIVSGSEMIDTDSEQEDYVAKAAAIFGSKPASSSLAYSDGLLGAYKLNNNPDGVIKSVEALIEISDKIADKSDKFIAARGAVWGYGTIGYTDQAVQVAKSRIQQADSNSEEETEENKSDYLLSLKILSYALFQLDAFPTCSVATVDYDLDGKPDFYDLGATQEQIDACGLTLDDDVDNDGILDINDLTPFYSDNT
ncbi:hypothetical protein [Thiomicrorhabdus heinhorstiae]|uniref:Uncharacterized protein n=1 Tax=Thiomicrorhabdus heinhorstiae TaxID=2748010 RepID=A0ABS0BVG5_9GAMM|nr:hypothetical protein [Thiomicrorhabdus heinhorstiae]MBF6057339.1 hypothetical protein [Thiomicrorhabdus heinhorstiae]